MSQEHMDVTVRTSLHYWSAILTGVIIGVGIQLTMGLIGLALGLYATGPVAGQPLSVDEIPAAVGSWWWLSSILALFAAGAAAGVMTRSDDLRQATLLGGTVWALAALFSAWIATTAVGTVVGGAAGALMSRPDNRPREIRVVIETAPASGVREPTARVEAPPRQVRPPVTATQRVQTTAGSDGGPVLKALETLSWYAVLQASRQLQKPEVRAMLRQYARAAWEETRDTRQAAANRIATWFETGGARSGETFATLKDYVMRTLLLTADEAERLIGEWRTALRSLEAGAVTSAANSDQSTAPEAPALTDEEVRAEVRKRIAAIASALERARSQMVGLIEQNAFSSPEARSAALQRIRNAFAASEAEAERILARWQRLAGEVLNELTRFAQQAGRTAEDGTQAALFALSRVAGWAALALLFGWIAATAGAFAGGRWAGMDRARDPADDAEIT
jgi:hypothetical protein